MTTETITVEREVFDATVYDAIDKLLPYEGQFLVVPLTDGARTYYVLFDQRCEEALRGAIMRDWRDEQPLVFLDVAEATALATGLNTGTHWLCELCVRPIPIPAALMDDPSGLICAECAEEMETAARDERRRAWDRDAPPPVKSRRWVEAEKARKERAAQVEAGQTPLF